MPIWNFYQILSVIVFTLWWLTMILSGPVPSIKMNHWVYETVQAAWWLKQDIDMDFNGNEDGRPLSGPPRQR